MVTSYIPGSDPSQAGLAAMITGTGGAGAFVVPRLRRRFWQRIAHQVRTMLLTRLLGRLSDSNLAMIFFGVVLFAILNLLTFPVPGRHYRDRRRLGVRRPVNWQQRTPHPPNDWKQSIHA
jgi:hypothetical protein